MPLRNNQVEDEPKVLSEQVTPPSTGPNKGMYWMKDVGGVTEAYYRDDQGRDIQLTDDGSAIGGGGGGASALNDLTDVNVPTPSNGQVLQYNGAEWISAAPAGGGDLLAANNLSDVANASTSLSNLGAEPALPVGTTAQYFRGDKTLSTFATDVAATAAVSANSAKVSADGSVATHSDVDLTGIASGNVLQWNGTNFAPVSLPGGGDLLSANNLSDVASASTSLSNLGGEPALPTGTTAQYFRGDKTLSTFATDVAATAAVTANTSKVSADGSVSTHSDVITGGITDGQILKWVAANSRFEPANETGGGGGAAVIAARITIPTAGSLAARLAAATGLPAGWSIVEGNDGSVHSSLTSFGAAAGDVVLVHNEAKPFASLRITKDIGGIIQQADFDPNTGEILESTDLNQVLLKSYESGANAGTGQSDITVVIPA
jgi:hypothetical protein